MRKAREKMKAENPEKYEVQNSKTQRKKKGNTKENS